MLPSEVFSDARILSADWSSGTSGTHAGTVEPPAALLMTSFIWSDMLLEEELGKYARGLVRDGGMDRPANRQPTGAPERDSQRKSPCADLPT